MELQASCENCDPRRKQSSIFAIAKGKSDGKLTDKGAKFSSSFSIPKPRLIDKPDKNVITNKLT